MPRPIMLLLLPALAFAEPLPYTSFAHLPMIEQPSVSPDGQYVAAILNGEEGPTVVVSEFGSRELNAVARLKYAEHRIEWIDWANDERLLVSVSESSGQGTEKFRIARLYHVGLDGEGMKQIRRKPTRAVPNWVQRIRTDLVLSLLPDDPDHILMQLWDERDEAFAVYRVEFARNDFDKLFANTYEMNRWWADDKGNVVFGAQLNVNTEEVTYWYRPEGGEDWRPLHTRKGYDGETFAPVQIAGGKAFVLSDYELEREALWQYDLESGRFAELLFDVEGYDVAGAILSNDRTRLLGAYYFDHFRVDHYFDADAARTAELIRTSFPGFHSSIVSRSQDGNRMVVSLVDDNVPPKYVWVDLRAGAANAWFSAYPYLDGKPLPEVRPFAFTARDGMNLNGYLTLPLAQAGDKPPLVVLPHGGPRGRDYQYFDYIVQFLANRGYAVLQVNFRGSEGFGTAYRKAGFKQWGRAMQTDIYDAMDWLAGQDRVDTGRACIVGWSYGGYAALVAAYQKPDAFRCVASIAGIADLYELAKLESLYRQYQLFIAEELGDPSNAEDRELLREYSAIRHVEQIEAPLLVVHGTEDTQVRIGQTRDFYATARAAGVDIEFQEIEDGTHYLDEYHNRLKVFAALEAFLAEHL